MSQQGKVLQQRHQERASITLWCDREAISKAADSYFFSFIQIARKQERKKGRESINVERKETLKDISLSRLVLTLIALMLLFLGL